MYCTIKEVTDMIKPDAINSVIGEGYIEDEAIKVEKFEPIARLAIEDADSEINGYLAKRYPTPLSSTPGIINKLSKDIAIYNIFSRSGIDEGERESNYLTRYKNAIKYLENVAKGIVDIEASSPSAPATSSGFVKISSNKKLFGRNSLEGM